MKEFYSCCLIVFAIMNITNGQIDSSFNLNSTKTSSISSTDIGQSMLNNTETAQELQESLIDDQQALRRMVMILSLVGGLGVFAVVTIIFIFTRMRNKNRKMNLISHSTEPTSSKTSSLCSLQRQSLEPSAPPFIEDGRQRVPSIIRPNTPVPSAPSAKELVEESDVRSSYQQHGHSDLHTCSQCMNLPPPAYTPSAPPYYL